MTAVRVLIAAIVAVALWQVIVWITGLPPYLLPEPAAVGRTLWTSRAELATAAGYTLAATLTGLGLGASLGILVALTMAMSERIGRNVAPLLIVSQTIPIFALAPVLTLWLGFGLAPKVAIVILIVFVPVTQAFYDGLMTTPHPMLDVARVMGASRWSMLRHLRMPAALPNLRSGLRLGTIYAPVGAVIGEWVGGAKGLGALMIQANGRMKADLMFAALIVVVGLALTLYATVEVLIRRNQNRRGY